MSDKLPGDKVYDDLIHPSFEAAGIIASLPIRALRVKLAPFEKWIIEGEKNIDLISKAISENLADVNPQNIVQPEAYIAVPALQGISYCMDTDGLRNLYAKLLASAMQIDKKNDVLPAFAEIIKQMSPTDALLLRHLYPNAIYPLVEVRYQKISSQEFQSLSEFKKVYQGLCIFDNLSFLLNDRCTIQEAAVSLENLSRLGIIQFSDKIVNETAYAPFISMSCCVEWMEELEHIKHGKNIPEEIILITSLLPDVEFALIPKSFYVTHFGKSFYKTCIS